jgi:hypothetical protein
MLPPPCVYYSYLAAARVSAHGLPRTPPLLRAANGAEDALLFCLNHWRGGGGGTGGRSLLRGLKIYQILRELQPEVAEGGAECVEHSGEVCGVPPAGVGAGIEAVEHVVAPARGTHLRHHSCLEQRLEHANSGEQIPAARRKDSYCDIGRHKNEKLHTKCWTSLASNSNSQSRLVSTWTSRRKTPSPQGVRSTTRRASLADPVSTRVAAARGAPLTAASPVRRAPQPLG